MIRRSILALLLSLSILAGCSALGLAGGATSLLAGGGGPSVDAELTIGDKKQAVNTQVGDDLEQQATVINNVKEVDHLLILIAVIGWLLPGPHEIWRGLTSLLPWRRSKR